MIAVVSNKDKTCSSTSMYEDFFILVDITYEAFGYLFALDQPFDMCHFVHLQITGYPSRHLHSPYHPDFLQSHD